MKIDLVNSKNLPKAPGVYLFLGEKSSTGKDVKDGRKILYIGKATSLRDRVKSYFSSDLIKTRGASIVDMVFKSEDIEWQETDTVLEALILEADQIKRYQPYYNVKEKDDKSFLCVGITKEDFPQVLTIRKRDIDFKQKTAKIARGKQTVKLQKVYGPFTSGGSLKEAMKMIRRIFPYRDSLSSKKDNYEFYRQLELTPDTSNADKKNEYSKTIKNIKLFFEGKKKQIIRSLEAEMKSRAKKHEFEKAGEIKRQLFALTHINDIALIKRDDEMEMMGVRPYRIEAYDIAHMSGQSMVGVMVVVRNQTAHRAGYRMFKIKSLSGANDPAALREVLTRRLKHKEWDFPDLIAVDGNEIQKRVAEEVLHEYNLPISVVAVVKDSRHKARAIIGDENIVKARKTSILIANEEAHRFAIAFHKKTRGKTFLS